MHRFVILIKGDFADAKQRFAQFAFQPFCLRAGGGKDIDGLFVADHSRVETLLK
ncbi:Uncharacterised protein [Mycobacterium tuberculosis]|nr:Uncharacterised protein [Mycobacterium tuberculosis]